MQISLVSLDNDTRHNERRTPQLEEVICSTHLLHLKDIGEDVAEGTLGVIGWSLIVATDGQLRFWQCLDIRLTIRCNRHLLHLQISRRHHILGKCLP